MRLVASQLSVSTEPPLKGPGQLSVGREHGAAMEGMLTRHQTLPNQSVSTVRVRKPPG